MNLTIDPSFASNSSNSFSPVTVNEGSNPQDVAIIVDPVFNGEEIDDQDPIETRPLLQRVRPYLPKILISIAAAVQVVVYFKEMQQIPREELSFSFFCASMAMTVTTFFNASLIDYDTQEDFFEDRFKGLNAISSISLGILCANNRLFYSGWSSVGLGCVSFMKMKAFRYFSQSIVEDLQQVRNSFRDFLDNSED